MIEEKRKTYPKWAGIALSFFLPGSAQFLSGQRLIGIIWYLLIEMFGYFSILVLAIPFNVAISIAIVFLVIAFFLWGLMLWKSYRHVRRIGFLGWIMVIVLAVLLEVSFKFAGESIVQTFIVPTAAMEPTIMGNKKNASGEKLPRTGDRLIVEKLSYYFCSPRRGHLAVFETDDFVRNHTGEYFIKRVVGLPGDKISIRPPYVYINSKKLVEPAIFKKLSDATPGYFSEGSLSDPSAEITLGENEYFLLGDNSSNSFDSRFYGPVPEDKFVGRAIRIIWPWSRMKILE